MERLLSQLNEDAASGCDSPSDFSIRLLNEIYEKSIKRHNVNLSGINYSFKLQIALHFDTFIEDPLLYISRSVCAIANSIIQ